MAGEDYDQQQQQQQQQLDDTLSRLEDEANPMTATPLLFLLDGCLSQDEERVQEALQEIVEVIGTKRMPSLAASPCVCPQALCLVLTALLTVRPDFCRRPSEHDGSLPLHFAASLGNVQVAYIVFQKVREPCWFQNAGYLCLLC